MKHPPTQFVHTMISPSTGSKVYSVHNTTFIQAIFINIISSFLELVGFYINDFISFFCKPLSHFILDLFSYLCNIGNLMEIKGFLFWAYQTLPFYLCVAYSQSRNRQVILVNKRRISGFILQNQIVWCDFCVKNCVCYIYSHNGISLGCLWKWVYFRFHF